MKALAPVKWLVTLEIGIWRSLLLWAARRVPGQRVGVESFSYASTPLLGRSSSCRRSSVACCG
jgi:hypothetical protein